eukprot:TRINITY_DN3736_c0_g1_i1.p1 TRINITY_DN3736_c0_g1~~TRINITY_DN3736_c0_g1_i1.p1  ORF type:complete len:305 (+),score=60.34 TRINITY_DN3736_c0_g1_i1:55-969(+)
MDGFPAPEERRVDPADGNSYTQAEFLAEYGSLERWNAAAPPAPAAPAAAAVPCSLFLAGLCPHKGESCPRGAHRDLGRAQQQQPQRQLTEAEAQKRVAELPPEDRQSAIKSVGGRSAWTQLSWVERLRVARPSEVPPAAAEAPAPSMWQVPVVEERRVDPADGNSYTQAEFIAEYGPSEGEVAWARAAPPCRPAEPLPVPHAPVPAAAAPAPTHRVATSEPRYSPGEQTPDEAYADMQSHRPRLGKAAQMRYASFSVPLRGRSQSPPRQGSDAVRLGLGLMQVGGAGCQPPRSAVRLRTGDEAR